MSVSDHQISKILEEFLDLHPKKIDLSLNRVKKLLSKLDNPHEKINNCVVVSGTNAKFSTIRFIQEILRYDNKTINTYISPHLVSFNERMEFKNKKITNEELEKILIKIKNINNSESITFFEAISSCFYDLCSQIHSDYTIIESGLGGMYDTSAVALPILTVITPISYDHMDFLGSSIQEIAFSKSGSIKRGVPCVIGKQTFPEALEILTDQAAHKKSSLFIYDRDWAIYERGEHIIYEDHRNKFEFDKFKYHPSYQIENLGVAIAAVAQLSIINIGNFLNEGLHNKTEIVGRFQRIENKKINKITANNVEIIYDGGHNVSAALEVSKSIEKLDKKPLCIILGMISSKSPENFISKFNHVECIKTINIPGEENTIPAEDLKNMISKYCNNVEVSLSIDQAIKEISRKYANARILITGSFYMAKEILRD